jgi:hypothetical protein
MLSSFVSENPLDIAITKRNLICSYLLICNVPFAADRVHPQESTPSRYHLVENHFGDFHLIVFGYGGWISFIVIRNNASKASVARVMGVPLAA